MTDYDFDPLRARARRACEGLHPEAHIREAAEAATASLSDEQVEGLSARFCLEGAGREGLTLVFIAIMDAATLTDPAPAHKEYPPCP